MCGGGLGPAAEAQSVRRLGSMRLLLTLSLCLVVTGCDPGWTYHVAIPQVPGDTTFAGSTDSTGLSLQLIGASLFATQLDVRVAVLNASHQGLTLDSTSVQVLDRDGRPLKLIRVAGCAIGYPNTQLPTCSPEASFEAHSTTRLFRPNPALKELTVRIQGLSATGQPVVLTLSLIWDLAQ